MKNLPRISHVTSQPNQAKGTVPIDGPVKCDSAAVIFQPVARVFKGYSGRYARHIIPLLHREEAPVESISKYAPGNHIGRGLANDFVSLCVYIGAYYVAHPFT
jgi:hypothetical protein